MGYALRLNSVDFSDVAVATVTYEDAPDVPCTGISLDVDTLSFAQDGEQKQIMATLTPANTTDLLVWESSNENIVSVDENGNVTACGIGNATITATCGEQNATVSVSISTLKAAGTLVLLIDINIDEYTTTNGHVLRVASTTDQNCIGKNYTGESTLRIVNGETNSIEAIKVPYGATKAKLATVEGDSMSLNYIFKADSTSLVEYGSDNFPEYISKTSWINSDTGADVEFGQCFMFRVDKTRLTKNPDYVYFT